jgi:hypothetical protein
MQEHEDEAPFDVIGAIIDYEQGDLDDDDTIALFQYLVDTGMAWSLQGHYGRVARYMIEQGFVTQKVGSNVQR